MGNCPGVLESAYEVQEGALVRDRGEQAVWDEYRLAMGRVPSRCPVHVPAVQVPQRWVWCAELECYKAKYAEVYIDTPDGDGSRPKHPGEPAA